MMALLDTAFCYRFCFLQLLYAVDVGTVIRFLPVVFNQLFHVLLVTGNEDVSLYLVK